MRYDFRMKTASKIYLLTVAFLSQSLYAEGRFGFDIGLDYQNYIYKEPSVMHIDGTMQGIVGSISYLLEDNKHHLKAGTYSDNLVYHGAKCNVMNPYNCESFNAKSKDKYHYVEYAAQLLMNMEPDTPIWFNAGMGYRILDNKVFDSSAYRRKQSYLYATLGLSGEHYLTRKTMLYINAYYRMLLLGKNTSYMTDIGFDKNLNFSQKKGYGALLEVGVRHQLPLFILSLEAYADYWNIQKSDTAGGSINGVSVGSYIEPKNHTLALGGRIKLSF